MARILITGMSGTGKSTVLEILRGRGPTVVETDDPGWCVPEDGDWNSPDNTWIWDESRISRLLDEHAGTNLFVAGCRANQGRLYDRFEYVVVLTAPLDVMLQRLANRTTNPYGSSPEQRQQIAADKEAIEPLLLSGADLIIDTATTSPEPIADRLESLL